MIDLCATTVQRGADGELRLRDGRKRASVLNQAGVRG